MMMRKMEKKGEMEVDEKHARESCAELQQSKSIFLIR
jgi:hypothetical protein